MPRPRKPRCVRDEPAFAFFKPQGIPLGMLEVLNLSVEELEALRLADIEGLYHEDAAERMEISRPTFHRVLKEAHRKVALALVEGRALGIEGGDYFLSAETRVLECVECGHFWEEPFGNGVRTCEALCPECGGAAVRLGCRRGREARGCTHPQEIRGNKKLSGE